MTQCARLLSWLREHGRVNPLTAWNELGIYRLSARVFDLQNHGGHKITAGTITVQNKFGEDCEVAEYRLETGNERKGGSIENTISEPTLKPPEGELFSLSGLTERNEYMGRKRR